MRAHSYKHQQSHIRAAIIQNRNRINKASTGSELAAALQEKEILFIQVNHVTIRLSDAKETIRSSQQAIRTIQYSMEGLERRISSSSGNIT